MFHTAFGVWSLFNNARTSSRTQVGVVEESSDGRRLVDEDLKDVYKAINSRLSRIPVI